MRLYEIDRKTYGGYDVIWSMIVRTTSAAKARKLAAEQCGGEGPEEWLDPEKSTCEILESEGTECVIIKQGRDG